MQPRRPRTQLLILVITVLALVAGTAAWTPSVPDAVSPAEPPAPHLELHCEMDFCVVEATHVLPVRHANHEVTFRWATTPAAGYQDNEDDVVRRTASSRDGERIAGGGGYRYAYDDVVWHSDIRCDDAVTVRMTSSLTAPASVSTDKPIPVSPRHAFCSAYGIGS